MKKNQTCVVRDCDSTENNNPELKFYPIPKEENVKKKWLKAINRSQDELTKRSKVCSKHFKSTDYTVTRFNYTVGDKNDTATDKSVCEWKALKTEVVPSLNLPEKSTFKIKISKKDNSKEVKVEEVKVKEEKDREKPHRMPKRPAPPPVETPSRSRRQASKEALKQMQLLLDDENDAVEIASDEDIIPVDPSPPPPPKKKYKLSHRKSSDATGDREVLVLKSITNRNAENTLELDCWVEPLDEVQKARIKKVNDEEKELQNKLDSLVTKGNGKIIHKGDLCSVIEVAEYVQSAIQAAQVPPNATPVVLNKSLPPNQSYQLVMDPRLGLIVGAVNQTGNSSPTPVTTPQKVYQAKVQVAQNLHPTPTTSANNQTRMRTRRGVVGGRTSPPPTPSTPPVINTPPAITTRSSLQTRSTPAKNIPTPPVQKTVTPTRTQIATRSNPVTNKGTPNIKNPPMTKSTPPMTKTAPPMTKTAPPMTKNAPPMTKNAPPMTKSAPPMTKSAPPPAKKAVPVATPPPPPPATRTRQSSSASPAANTRPSEDNVEGGLATGSAGGGQTKKVVVDLTSDEGKSMADSKEIAFSKLQGKTYPSLVVVARPHLRVQDVNVDRPKLDAKVKSVLMHQPTKFTEWLIQQGLIRSEQKCSTHNTQLKLGIYSDVSKFPYSGGYVWISECCPHRFVSVFSGSLFEGAPHPPMVILKLLYHWACQTNIQNVTQWVKVDNLYVKVMFTWLRCVTTVALQTHLRKLGGPGTKVEVGVISLGTTSQDGNQRQVKVEVIGILETTSKLVRLRAVEPQTEGEKNYKRRFSKILEPIQDWVHRESILVADLTIDKQTLNNMGFMNVIQSSGSDYGQNNRQIMEYLRRIVPRMFQNTLSLLSRQIIQQFLDELVWREWYGTTSLQAFDNLVQHLAEQTRYDNFTLITRLNRVAQFPFKNWALPRSVTNTEATTTAKPTENITAQQQNQKKPRNRKELNNKPVQQLATKSVQQVPLEVNRPPKSISPDVPEQMVPLENYYYGTIDNYTKTPKITLNMKCPFCKSVFDNNIQLMNHLFKHAHNVSQDAQLCRYCLTSVPTANDLLKHIATSHPAETKFDNGFVCLICETQYMNPFILGKHMSKEHCPSELPYQCGTCGYRCSNHKQAIDHFYKTHDNGPTIQCPFCLKSTTVFTSSRNIHQNMNYFIQHLQKHQRKQFARRCGKCNLWFVQKDVLRDHQQRMHVSQRGKPRLVPWNAPRNGVMVPKSKMDKYPGDADVINFTLLTVDVPKNLMCKECNTPMSTTKHFPSFESCQNPNCQYSTCCTNAMQEHNAKCSKNQNPIEREKLPFEMFCICGYRDIDGNQMARHLAICERKSAYPSRAEAQAAIVTHSMLDVLGLVRKPDETKKDETDVPITLESDVRGDDVAVVEKMEVDKVKEEPTKTRRVAPAPLSRKEKKPTSDNESVTSEKSRKSIRYTKKKEKRVVVPPKEVDEKEQKNISDEVIENEDSESSQRNSEAVKEDGEPIEENAKLSKLEEKKNVDNDVSKTVEKEDDNNDISETIAKKGGNENENKIEVEVASTGDSEGKGEVNNDIEESESNEEPNKKPDTLQDDKIIENTPTVETSDENVETDIEKSDKQNLESEKNDIAAKEQEKPQGTKEGSKEADEDRDVSTKDKQEEPQDIFAEGSKGAEVDCDGSTKDEEEEPKDVISENSQAGESSSDVFPEAKQEPEETVSENSQTDFTEDSQHKDFQSEKFADESGDMLTDDKQDEHMSAEENQLNESIKDDEIPPEVNDTAADNKEQYSECRQSNEENNGDSKKINDVVESTFKSLEDRAIEDFDVLNSGCEEEGGESESSKSVSNRNEITENNIEKQNEQFNDDDGDGISTENITNHVNQNDEDDCKMETADIMPTDHKSQESDITTDDIQNFISDMVGEGETDDVPMVSIDKHTDTAVTIVSTANDVVENEEATTPMETD